MGLAEPQTTDELLVHLCSREAPWDSFRVLGFGGGNHDAFALERGVAGFSIRYWERGEPRHVELEDAPEAAACARYLELLDGMRRAVAMLPSAEAAQALALRLVAEGLDARLNPVHPGVWGGPITQVLVPLLQLQAARRVALFPGPQAEPSPPAWRRVLQRWSARRRHRAGHAR